MEYLKIKKENFLKKIVLLLSILCITAQVKATTNIKVYNRADEPIYVAINSHGFCAHHHAVILPAKGDWSTRRRQEEEKGVPVAEIGDWNIDGCQFDVEIDYPDNSKATKTILANAKN